MDRLVLMNRSQLAATLAGAVSGGSGAIVFGTIAAAAITGAFSLAAALIISGVIRQNRELKAEVARLKAKNAKRDRDE